jgi:subfamily B ATP-binding cassette protein HlyB/CyaB
LMIAEYHGINADEAKLRHEFGQADFVTSSILLAAKQIGMSAKLVKQSPDRLNRTPLPAVAIDLQGHYCIVGKYDESASKLLIQCPGESPKIVSLVDFLALWSGQFIFFTSKANYAGDVSKFDFSWFIPAIIKYRKLLGEVVLISFVLQIIGLTTPMFFQVVMDKVLVNREE